MSLNFSFCKRAIVKVLVLGIAILIFALPERALATPGSHYSAIHKKIGRTAFFAAPVADAGYDQTIGLPRASFTLHGSGYDPDGTAVTFLWTKQSGPTVSMSGTTTSMLTLTNIVAGTYVFRLTVTDNTSSSAWDEVTVSVSNIPDNRTYIKEETVLKSGVTAIAQLPTLTVDDKNTSTVYYDDSGKKEQAVMLQGSPSKKDQVGVVVYDEVGRRNIDYMPIVYNSTDGQYKSNPLIGGGGTYSGSPHYQFYHGSFPNIATDESPFARTEFEKSPLARTTESGGYGAAFQPNLTTPSQGKTTKMSYATNADDEVLQLFAQGSQLIISSVYFPSGTLNVNTITNPDNVIVKEYYNNKGQKILQRSQANTAATLWADTYYVYDDVGNMIFIIPPQLSEELSADYTSAPVTGGINGNFASENTTIPLGSSQTTGYTYWQRASVTVPAGFTALPGFYIRPVANLVGNLSVVNSDIVELYAFQKAYDNLNRLIASKSPGADWEYFVYDRRGHLVLSQDGNQRSRNEWTFTKYDIQDRPVMTGLVTSTSSLDQIRSTVASQAVIHEDRGSAVFHYTNNAYPSVSDPNAYLAITYYDDIQTVPEAYAEIEEAELLEELTSQTIQEMMNTSNNKGLVVHTKRRILGTSQWLGTSFFYDRFHRNVFTSMKEEGTGVTAFRELRVANVYDDFTDKITKQRVVSNAFQGTAGRVKRFEYDHAGRLLKEYSSAVIGDVQPEIVTASYEYNELGEVIDKKIHSADNGATWLQSLDYRYNIQGSLTTVNNLTGVNGAYMTNLYHAIGLTDTGPFTGAWRGAVSGMVGGGIGGYVGGFEGALVGGMSSGATGTALNGGDLNDIIRTGITGGAISLAAYQAQLGVGFMDYQSKGGSWNYRQFRKINEATQWSFGRGREQGGWITTNDVILDPPGSRASNIPAPKPSGALARFHTHPNWGPGWIESHSGGVPIGRPPGDMETTYYVQKVTSYVIGRQNMYSYSSFMYSLKNYTPVNTGVPIVRYPNYVFLLWKLNFLRYENSYRYDSMLCYPMSPVVRQSEQLNMQTE